MNRRDFSSGLLGAGALAGWAGAARAQSLAERRPWSKHTTTPELDAPCFDGPDFHLAALRGKVVLLNFWASWCPSCRDEMSSFELLATRFAEHGLAVVAVNYRETDRAIQRFTEQLVGDLRIARDADGRIAKAFGVRVFPTTVAVDRQGRAAFSVVGGTDWMADPARQWVAELLVKKV